MLRALTGAAANGVRSGLTPRTVLTARQEATHAMARQRRSVSQAQNSADARGGDPLTLPAPVRLRAPGCRPALRTVDEAIHMIDTELPAELSRLPRWTFARALLVEATKTGRKRDLTAAVRQVRQALSNEGWLIESDENEAAGG